MAFPRIAFAVPTLDVWSETFIAAQLQHLQEVELVLAGGALPTRTGEDVPILSATRGHWWRNHYERRILRLTEKDILRKRITSLLKQHRVQVVLAEFGSAGDAMRYPCRAAGIPLVVHFHGKDAHCETNLRAHGHYKQLLKEAAAIVVVSRAMEHQLLELGAPRERLHYICYGINVDQFSAGQPADQAPRFLSVGRFTDKKAPLITFLAFRQAWLERPEARLTMIGGGDLWESVRQLRAVFGMEQVVELAGVRSPAEVAVAMKTCRAFVQHSVTTADNDMEGTPLAVLEAMASGLPVISTRHAGIADVVLHGERGLLSREYDLAAMARHMVQLTDDPGLASDMGKAGRAYAATAHRVEVQVAALQSVIDQVAGRTG